MRAWNFIGAAILMASVAPSAQFDTLRVPEDYPTIQAAIDAAADGDVVLVAPGTYNEYLFLFEKNITIRSSNGPEVTILAGDGTGIGLDTEDTHGGFAVDGFTFRNYGRGISSGLTVGDGTTISQCIFTQCTQRGISLSAFEGGSDLFVESCEFRDNGGAGLAYGGDLSLLRVTDCVFERNSGGGARLGGSLGADPRANFNDCVFRDNQAVSGGAIFADNCLLFIARCLFENNVAADEGGALYWRDYGLSVAECEFRSNSAGSSGGAIAGENSVFGPKGHGVDDSFLEGNQAPFGSQISLLEGSDGSVDSFHVECSIVEGGAQGVHIEDYWTLVWYDTSNLQDLSIGFGTLLNGGLMDLTCSDDRRVQVRSRPGFTSNRTHIVDLRVGAISPELSPEFIDLVFEGRLTQPGGSGRFRLRNWTTGNWFRVHDFPIGTSEIVEVINGIDAAEYVRESDGRIEVSVFQSAVATFSAGGFESFTDQVVVATR